MAIAVERAGEFEGERIDEVTLVGDTGVEVRILSWGVTVRDWRVPAPEGMRAVALGFGDFSPYPEHSPYFGCVVGRVANRIGGAGFDLGGRRYELPANEGAVHLHGGPGGLSRLPWRLETDAAANAVRFTHLSPDGAMGYPGAVAFEAIYTLSGSRLRLDLYAMPDRETPISLVQHHYFNLGDGDTVLDHEVRIDAPAYTELGPELVPTGAILPVTGTDYDLRAGRTLRDADGRAIDYDLNLVLASGRDQAEPAAEVTGPDGALTLKLWTDRPGVQLYNGVMTDVAVPGHGGRRYGRHSGLCLEDQMFPDAMNNPHFPSILVSPDRPYRHWCLIEIA